MKQLKALPLGAIRPSGWLERQLRLQASGLTGNLEEVWPDVGPDSGWLGGTGENWERGPYYLDGLVPLAYVLEDDSLKARARKWIEWMLVSQAPDGWFGPRANDDWWPRMVALKVLMQYESATGDPRVVPFISAYFDYQLQHLAEQPLEQWGKARGGENLLAVRWLLERKPSASLETLASLIEAQTYDWDDYFHRDLLQQPATSFSQLSHVVNVAMATKNYAVMAKLAPEASLSRSQSALERLDRFHGQVNGMFSGDEWLAGKSPSAGVETCAVVEFMFSLQCLWREFGDSDFIDRLERVAFNALPAALSADATSHQYHQQPNQVSCTIDRREWTFSSDAANTFGLEPHFGCCTANLHQGWPKFVASLWSIDECGDLVVGTYAPNSVRYGQWRVRLETDYPFNDRLHFYVDEAPENGALNLRIPPWCTTPALSIDDVDVSLGAHNGSVRQRVVAGNTVTLHLPREVRIEGRPRDAIGVLYGPLVMCHSPGEIWQRLPEAEGERPRGAFGDWEVRSRTWWNIALARTTEQSLLVRRVEQKDSADRPFCLSGAPVRLRVAGIPLKDWRIESGSAAPPPYSPAHTEQPLHDYWLIPYGCARLRIAEFPWVTDRPACH